MRELTARNRLELRQDLTNVRVASFLLGKTDVAPSIRPAWIAEA
jgi:hypothetical protein